MSSLLPLTSFPSALVGNQGRLYDPNSGYPSSSVVPTMPTSMDLSSLGQTAIGANVMGGGSEWDPSAFDRGLSAKVDLSGSNNNNNGGLFGWLRDGENLSALAQGIGALSGAWLGRKQLGIARDNLNFQRDAFERNFANQTRSYNTSLEDRIRGRSADYAGKESDVQAYLDRHRLTGT